MSHHIKLTFEAPSREYARGRDSFRFRVTASDGVNMPNEIFLAEHMLVDPENPESEVKFSFLSICSAYDLSIYPANAAVEGQSPPFFRVSVIDIPLPSLAVYDEVVEQVKAQVGSLLSQCDKLDNMEVVEEVWIPSVPSAIPTTTTTPPPP